MSASQWLQVVHESSYGTVMTTPVALTNSHYINLPESNSFTTTAVPVPFLTPYGGGFDVAADLSIDHYTVGGRLATLLYPGQPAFWMGMALQRVNTGQTVPITTTEPPGDLASFSVYHGVKTRAGTIKRFRLPGTKVTGFEISVSRSDPRAKLVLDLVHQKQVGHTVGSTSDPDGTEFPLPAESDYATGPYLLSETTGEFKRAGVALTQYQSLTIRVQNKLDPLHYETPWLSTCGAHGREATLTAEVLYKTSPDHLADLQAGTARAYVVKFTKGTKVLTINFNANNHVSAATYNLGLGKEFLQQITVTNKWDRTALAGVGDDVTYTYAAS